MLRKSTGNMYGFITHTWNPIKGACPHRCSYCYMDRIYRRFGKTPAPPHLDRNELRADLGSGNTIFVGSSCDMFASSIDHKWIFHVMLHVREFPENRYFFQTKNTFSLFLQRAFLPDNVIVCTTLETNRDYRPVMGTALSTRERAFNLADMKGPGIERQVTIEPVLDFDLKKFVDMIKLCEPAQVNIGADSGNNGLPEPPKEKLAEFVRELGTFTKVYLKSNLGRLVN